MCNLLTFIIITILFFLAGGFAFRTFWAMIQPGGAFDIAFGWQKMMGNLYDKASQGDKRAELLEKVLGGCEQCTAFWFMPIWYGMYYGFCKIVLQYWVTDHLSNWIAIVFINWVWMALFWSIGAVLGLFMILKKKK